MRTDRRAQPKRTWLRNPTAAPRPAVSAPLTAFFLLALCSPARAIDVDNPPKGLFSDEWYVINISGQKSGHAHNTMERAGSKDGDIIRSKTEMTIAMKRLGEGVQVSVTQRYEETLQGEPLGFSNTMRLGMLPMTTRGVIKDGKITITSAQLGQQAQAKTYDVPQGAMMSWGIYRQTIKKGLKPGTSYEYSMYEPSMAPDQLLPAKVEIQERELIDLYGRKVETVRAKQTMTMKNMLGQETDIETTTWMTDDGNVLRMRMPFDLMKTTIELIACSKSVAMAPNDPAELMAETLMAVDQPVDRTAPRLRYRLSLKDRSATIRLPKLPETDIQKIDARSSDQTEIRLTISRPAPHGEGRPNSELSADERKDYLAASPLLNHEDPVVKKLARQAAGDEKDPWKLADKLRRFVTEYVSTKGLSVGFATASEVARSKEGDCTEHGVLLAALGRAVGIPTRLVTGLVYVDDYQRNLHVFGGHMWTQFWIEGRWVDLDAAQRQTEVDATHIAFSISDGGNMGVADLVNSLWLNLGKMRITVLDEQGNEPASRPR